MSPKLLSLLMKMHGAGKSRLPVLPIEWYLKNLIRSGQKGSRDALWPRYIEALQLQALENPIAAKFKKNPGQMMGSMAIVLKEASPEEKGVLLLQYSYFFPLFRALFDIRAVMKHYHLVLEPSWTGYCDGAILAYAGLEEPVFVQSMEPRDSAFLLNVSDNLVPVETGANWWSSPEAFYPRPEVQKDADLCMIASWARFKRHGEVFHALSRIKRKGRELRLILIGYPCDLTKDDIFLLARREGVERQIELHERIPSDQVALNLARCKVNLVWSKREGVNRAIIEGFMAGVPGILREGFNYGHRYRYINPQTAVYASSRDLEQKILYMTDHHQEFAPRQWIMENMTCWHACETISEVIAQSCRARGERFNGPISAKVNTLDCMQYLVSSDYDRYARDYERLLGCLRFN